MQQIYLDNAATTQVDSSVADIAYQTMIQEYGNPSSLHRKGWEAELLIDKATKQLASALGCPPETLFFTSGGTEANNLALFGCAYAKKRRGNRLVTTAVEHSSVKETMEQLAKEGFEVVTLVPDSHGKISAQQVLDAVDEKTILVSVMYANNEVGTIMPIEEIVSALRKKAPEISIHCDAVQAFGKVPIGLKKLDVDLLSVSGHKIYAPKGVGALYVKKGVRILPRMFGGEQQNKIRPGTQSVPLIVAMGLAAEIMAATLPSSMSHGKELKEYFNNQILSLPGILSNSPEDGLSVIRNISIEGYRSEVLLHALEDKGIYLSSGSACAKGASSHVLTAMGLSQKRRDSALRISFGKYNTLEEIDCLRHALQQVMSQIRRVG